MLKSHEHTYRLACLERGFHTFRKWFNDFFKVVLFLAMFFLLQNGQWLQFKGLAC